MSDSIIKTNFIVYLITCNITGLQYIGQTFRKLHLRWKQHFGVAKSSVKKARLKGDVSSLFCEHLVLFGEEGFEIKPIYYAKNLDELFIHDLKVREFL